MHSASLVVTGDLTDYPTADEDKPSLLPSAIRQIVQIVALGRVPVGAQILAGGTVEDPDLRLRSLRPRHPIFVKAVLDVGDRARLLPRGDQGCPSLQSLVMSTWEFFPVLCT